MQAEPVARPRASEGAEDAHGAPPRAARAELQARVVSSLVLAPAALWVTWLGGPVFAGVMAAAGVVLAREWTRMADPQGSDLAFALAASGAAGAVIAASASPAAGSGSATYIAGALGWIALASVLAGVEARGRGRGVDAALGVAYVGAPCAAMVWVRLQGDGRGSELIWFLFAAVWGADIGAYAAGKLMRGPRLAPRISVNKTWAGIGGGVMLAAALAALAASITGWPAALGAAILGGMALGAVGLAGDLWESALKRRYGVKDAGALIPGHGGLLDRVDGLMAGALALAVWVAVRALATG